MHTPFTSKSGHLAIPTYNAKSWKIPRATCDAFPIWPIVELEDRHSLKRICELFEADLEVVGEHYPAKNNFFANGVVAYCRRSLKSHANLYAHLTGRSAQFCKWQTLARVKGLSVILTTFSDISSERLKIIEDLMKRGIVPGLICGETENELRTQILLRSAATYLSRHAAFDIEREGAWIDIFSLAPFHEYRLKGRTVIGGLTSAQTLKTALQSKAGLLRIVTASDGIDLPIGDLLGKRLLMCGMGNPPAHAAVESSPRCVSTGFCHRHKKPIAQVISLGSIIGPEAISARALLLQSCLGVIVGSHTTDDAWGLGRRLVTSNSIGAVITTDGYSITSNVVNTEDFTHSLACGASLGDGLAQYVAEMKNEITYRFFLFGDPMFRLNSNPNAQALRLNFRSLPKQGKPSRRKKPIPNRELKVLLSAIEACPEHERTPVYSVVSDRIKRPCDTGDKWSASESGEPAMDLKPLIMEYMIQRFCPRWIEDWLRNATQLERVRGIICPTCKIRVTSGRAYHYLSGGAVRRVSVCVRCGPIEDTPWISDLRLIVSRNGTCQLKGTLPQRNWIASLVVYSDLKSECAVTSWPRSKDGTPARRFTPQIEWPTGPLRIAFYMLSDSWYLLTQPFRRHETNQVTVGP